MDDYWFNNDPIKNCRNYIISNKLANEEELDSIDEKIEKRIDDAVEFAKNSPEPSLDEILTDIYDEGVSLWQN